MTIEYAATRFAPSSRGGAHRAAPSTRQHSPEWILGMEENARMRTEIAEERYNREQRIYDVQTAAGPRSSPRYRKAFRSYLQGDHGRALRAAMPNNPGMTTAATGDNAGVLAPASFDATVLKSLVYSSSLLPRVRIWRSLTGSAATTPTVFAASGEQAIAEATISEVSAVTQNDVVVNRLVWGVTPTWGLKDALSISRALLADSGINAEVLVAELFAQRLSRGWDASAWATVRAQTWTTTVTSAAAAAPAVGDLLSLLHGVDPGFRTPNAAWYCNDATVKLLRALADTAGRPLMIDAPSVTETTNSDVFGGNEQYQTRQPLLFGFPVVSTRALPTWAAAATNAILFGDMARGGVMRMAGGCEVQTVFERFAEWGAVGLVARARLDFLTADPAAISSLTVHA